MRKFNFTSPREWLFTFKRGGWHLSKSEAADGQYVEHAKNIRRRAAVRVIFFGTWLVIACGIDAAENMSGGDSTDSAHVTVGQIFQANQGIWDGEVGEGFRRSTSHWGVLTGVAPGLEEFGSSQARDLALVSVSYGKIWGGVQAKDHWWRGNWEWRVELIAGSEFHPSVHYFGGLTPHLRYNFATGTRWIPFVDFGSGVSVTSIGLPDLGGPFQFNTQVSLGMNYFIKQNLALSLEGRAMHVSSAGIYQPNNGMNNLLILAGVNWLF